MVRVLSVPEDHDVVRSALPPDAVVKSEALTLAARRGWDIDPVWDPRWLGRQVPTTDVVHVHFGFEVVPTQQLQQWLQVLSTAGVPLVVTVHDLDSPHLRRGDAYRVRLSYLLSAASKVTTLTPGAAAQLERVFGVEAEVVPHPPIVDSGGAAHRPGLIGMTVKKRPQNRGIDGLVAEIKRGLTAARAGDVDARAVVRLADEPTLGRLRARCVDDTLITFDKAAWESPAEFSTRLSSWHACVLPYSFGTHSGVLEACRDTGTTVIAPDCGYYVEQWPAILTYRRRADGTLVPGSLAAAVTRAVSEPPPLPETAARRQARMSASREAYRVIYESVTAQRRSA